MQIINAAALDWEEPKWLLRAISKDRGYEVVVANWGSRVRVEFVERTGNRVIRGLTFPNDLNTQEVVDMFRESHRVALDLKMVEDLLTKWKKMAEFYQGL